MQRTIDFYNAHIGIKPTYSSSDINWTRATLYNHSKQRASSFAVEQMREAMYRPFCKSNLYFDRTWNEMSYQIPKLFPTPQSTNLVICVSGVGGKTFSTMMTDVIPDLHILESGTQCFPLYYYDKIEQCQISLFDQSDEEYVRCDGISDFMLSRMKQCNPKITKEDIFYYIYGILHNSEYRRYFEADLGKMIPRIPVVETYSKFNAFCKAGRQLATLHLNYEQGVPCDSAVVIGSESGNFQVEKMRFISKGDKRTIIFNSNIRVENIPLAAYDYIVNGKSAIEWIMERYQITRHAESQILNDPNLWTPDNPKYILNLLLKIIQMSLESMKIITKLPELKFDS
jgi:predicted helicase